MWPLKCSAVEIPRSACGIYAIMTVQNIDRCIIVGMAFFSITECTTVHKLAPSGNLPVAKSMLSNTFNGYLGAA